MTENKICFVDTNIWLYALVQTQEQEKSETAQASLRRSAPVVSTQVINEVCVNLLKKTEIGEDGISRLVEAFYAKYPVIELDKTVLLTASQLRTQYSLSYWDSLIVACALTAGIEVLYTEDIQYGLIVDGKLKIVNPFTK